MNQISPRKASRILINVLAKDYLLYKKQTSSLRYPSSLASIPCPPAKHYIKYTISYSTPGYSQGNGLKEAINEELLNISIEGEYVLPIYSPKDLHIASCSTDIPEISLNSNTPLSPLKLDLAPVAPAQTPPNIQRFSKARREI